MKIQKSCQPTPPTPAPLPNVPMSNIPTGTVFRYGSLSCGPYIVVRGAGVEGILDFANGYVYAQVPSFVFTGVVNLPKAFLVTGEE